MAGGRTAAVAGAGIAGLAAAAALAQRGFAVQVFEKSANPREFGAGIYLKENSLPVLDALGAGGRVAASGVRIRRARIADEHNRIIVSRSIDTERLIVVERAELHAALLQAALDAGVSVITDKTVTGARPDGTLLLDGAEPVRADLVIAADGRHSRIRESLGLTKVSRDLGSGATRLLIPRQEEPLSTEYWAGDRRVGVAPCSADSTYVFIIAPEKDHRAVRVPVDRAYWKTVLPHLAGVLDQITSDIGVHHAHTYVTCRAWAAGRVAIIGDAAHAQPPNFGQGAGLAIAAAWQLARLASAGPDIPGALTRWEAQVRPGVDTVQRLTTAYDLAGHLTPAALLPVRAQFFHGLSTFRPTARRWEYWWRGGLNAPDPGHPLGPTCPPRPASPANPALSE
jgi:2-polyprenyl-6-methoxyphenol hydroxylase-like FAD-dependent oxidoreductase